MLPLCVLSSELQASPCTHHTMPPVSHATHWIRRPKTYHMHFTAVHTTADLHCLLYDMFRVCVFHYRGFPQSAAAFLMSFFPGSSEMTIITDEDENEEVIFTCSTVAHGCQCSFRCRCCVLCPIWPVHARNRAEGY